jgi:hypothetical protein
MPTFIHIYVNKVYKNVIVRLILVLFICTLVLFDIIKSNKILYILKYNKMKPSNNLILKHLMKHVRSIPKLA